MKRVCTSALGLTILLGLGLSAVQAQEPVAFTTISQGSESGIHAPTELVIRTASEWRALWHRHTAGTPQTRTVPPAVDFSREMVVAAFAGEVPRSSRLAILKIFPNAGRLVVLVRLRGPGGPELDGVNPATPFHIVRLPRSRLPVVFVKTKTPDLE